MRLFEITRPHPTAKLLARMFEDHYRRLYEDFLRQVSSKASNGILVSGNRIIFDASRFKGSVDIDEQGAARKRIEEILHDHGWRLADWRRGFVEREEERTRPDTGERLKRTVRRRLVPVLREIGKSGSVDQTEIEQLIREFERDPSRRGASSERQGRRQVIVLTFDPLENAHMSTRRGWTSCKTIRGESGSVFERIVCDLRAGIIVVWLTDEADSETLDRPVARANIAMLIGPSGSRIFRRTSAVYGSAPPWFENAVESIARWLTKAAGTVRPGLYRMVYKAQTDYGSYSEMVNVDINEVIYEITRNPEKAVDTFAITPGIMSFIIFDMNNHIGRYVGNKASIEKIIRYFDLIRRAYKRAFDNEGRNPDIEYAKFAATIDWLKGDTSVDIDEISPRIIGIVGVYGDQDTIERIVSMLPKRMNERVRSILSAAKEFDAKDLVAAINERFRNQPRHPTRATVDALLRDRRFEDALDMARKLVRSGRVRSVRLPLNFRGPVHDLLYGRGRDAVDTMLFLAKMTLDDHIEGTARNFLMRLANTAKTHEILQRLICHAARVAENKEFRKIVYSIVYCTE